MIQSVIDIRVDISKLNTFQAVVAKQYDNASRFLRVTVTDQGKELSIDRDCLVTLNMRRPDKKAKSFEGSVNSDGTLLLPLPAWGLALDGTCVCDISIYGSNGEKLTTLVFTVEVQFSAFDEERAGEDDEGDGGLILTLIEAIKNASEYVIPKDATVYYYNTLEDCIYDVNFGEADKAVSRSLGNVCCWYREEGIGGRIHIVLLKNAATSVKHTIDADVALDLAGHVIDADLTALGTTASQNLFSFQGKSALIDASMGGKIRLNGSNACGIFNVSPDCEDFCIDGGEYEINGAPSNSNNAVIKLYGQRNYIANAKIRLSKEQSETTGTKASYGIQASGGELTVDRCLVDVKDRGGSSAMGIYCNNSPLLRIKGGSIKAVGTDRDSYGVYCVKTDKMLIDGDPYIYTDAADNGISSGKGVARAILSRANYAAINGGTYIGTHSGLSLQAGNSGKSFVHVRNAKTYSCGHGGFYATTNVTAVMENSEIGWRAYDGIHDYSGMSNAGSGFYIGGSANATGISVYLDGCALVGDAPTGHCGVLRGTDGEYGNTLYISRTTYPAGKKFRVDGSNYLVAGLEVSVTADDVEQNGHIAILADALKWTKDLYSLSAIYTNEKIGDLSSNPYFPGDTVNDAITRVGRSIGGLGNLTTYEKGTLVEAINNIHARLTAIEHELGRG